MKAIAKYVNVYREMMFEHIKIYEYSESGFSEEKIKEYNNELYKLHDEFEFEYKQDLIDLSDDVDKLRSYLMRYYVCGFKRIECIIEQKSPSFKQDSKLTELDKTYLNFRQGIKLLCSNFIQYLKLNLKIEISKIDCEKYVLGSNDYYGEFKLSRLPQREKLDFKFKNNFDRVDEEQVYSYFKKHLVESNMLTNEDLKQFLRLAFEEKNATENLFILKGAIPKYKVIKIFYSYYKGEAGKPHGRQKEFAALLGDYFQDYDTHNVSTNFAK